MIIWDEDDGGEERVYYMPSRETCQRIFVEQWARYVETGERRYYERAMDESFNLRHYHHETEEGIEILMAKARREAVK